jgi:hypothetical protein
MEFSYIRQRARGLGKNFMIDLGVTFPQGFNPLFKRHGFLLLLDGIGNGNQSTIILHRLPSESGQFSVA